MSQSMGGPEPNSQVVVALQDLIRASYATLHLLEGGLTVNTSLPVTTVAGLPATAPAGSLRFASNGRNTGQGSGAGTGCVVVGSGSGWVAVWSGVAVTA